MEQIIVIRGHGSISVLGHDATSISESYQSGRTHFQLVDDTPVAALQYQAAALIEQIFQEHNYRGLDRCVIMAIYAARQAVKNAGWELERNVVINIGSSRGATGLSEHYFNQFKNTGRVSPSTSPVTTLGNVSSWVGQDLNSRGARISHSVTCSTGLQAIANGFAWLKSGMADKFLAGASEAPLTPFTIAQMKALGIYSDDSCSPYPCRPLNISKKNTFVLGEGAAVFALERISHQQLLSDTSNPVIIESVGFGFEQISSKTGISTQGNGFKSAIQDALEHSRDNSAPDMIILHAPGTVAGDFAELNAIKSLFSTSQIPVLCSGKWMTGHTLGASGCLTLEYAIWILK
ncbi:MAG: beta-ketoacyl-ACP reductase, partial [Pyrinomonadaceae bacterium]|nr:beta-ketoacyl-ACP reductase [Sphingobacteriaceae bacterium]